MAASQFFAYMHISIATLQFGCKQSPLESFLQCVHTEDAYSARKTEYHMHSTLESNTIQYSRVQYVLDHFLVSFEERACVS